MTLGSVAPPTVAEIVTFFKYENNQTDESHICLKKKSFGNLESAVFLVISLKKFNFTAFLVFSKRND
jgi:hypothetical protein